MSTDWRFANFLAKKAYASHWDMSELSRRLKTTRPTVYRYVRGRTIPTPALRRDMFQGFGFANVDVFDAVWLSESREQSDELITLLKEIGSGEKSEEFDPNSAAKFLAARGEKPPTAGERTDGRREETLRQQNARPARGKTLSP